MNRNKQPNILFAIADDASHMSAYSHRFVYTPNFDRVARDGMLFANAFTTNPKCSPSRASILTGRHTWQLEEACDHYGIFPSKFPVFPDLLENDGYHVGYTGKGWAPGNWEKGGFKRNPAGNEYNKKTLTPPFNTGISNIDYYSNFVDFIDKRQNESPFYFWYGSFEPHRKYVEGEGLRAGKKLETVDVPSYLPDVEEVKCDLLDYAYEIEWFDKHLGKIIDEIEKMGELENTLIIVTSDNGMPFPRVKGQLYEQDFHLPLAMSWGEVLQKGRKIDDLVSFIDIAPTILDAAGICTDEMAMAGSSLMDIILSSATGLINEKRNKVFMGKERHDIGREGDKGYPVRCIRTSDYLYVRNFEPERWPAGNPETGFTEVDSSPTKAYILREHEKGNDTYFHLCFSKHPLEELYKIKTDPECMENLAEVPEYMEVKKCLWSELREKLNETGDPRIFGRGDVFDSCEYTGNSRHSWRAYIQGKFEKQIY